MTEAEPVNGRWLRALASWLAVWPVFFLASPIPTGADAAIVAPAEPPIERTWWSAELPEQLIRLLPGGALETAARSLVEQKVQVRLDHDRAFLQVRIPLG